MCVEIVSVERAIAGIIIHTLINIYSIVNSINRTNRSDKVNLYLIFRVDFERFLTSLSDKK